MPVKLFNRIARKVSHNWYVKVISVALAALLWIYVDGLSEKERFLTVPFEVKGVPEGYTVSSDTPPYAKIVLRGKEENLSLVSEEGITAYVVMEKGKRGKMKGIVRIDRKGIPPGVSIREVSPRTVDMTVEDMITRSVGLSPVIAGGPAEGYMLSDVYITPQSVRVRGPESLVKRIGTLYTESISIDGISETEVVETRVKHEDGKVSLLDAGPVSVTIVVEEEFVIRHVPAVSVGIRGLGVGLRADVEPRSASLILKVPKRLEEELSSEDLRVYINVEEIANPGSYQLPLIFVTGLEKVSPVRIDPEYAGVTVQALKTGRK